MIYYNIHYIKSPDYRCTSQGDQQEEKLDKTNVDSTETKDPARCTEKHYKIGSVDVVDQ